MSYNIIFTRSLSRIRISSDAAMGFRTTHIDEVPLAMRRTHAVLHPGVVWRAVGPSCLVVRFIEVLPLENNERRYRDRIRDCLQSDDEAKCAPAAVSAVRTFAPAFLADCTEHWRPVKRLMLPAFGGRRVDATGAKDLQTGSTISRSRTAGGGEPRAGSGVIDDEARRGAWTAARGLQSVQGLRRRKAGFEAHYLTDDEFDALGRALDGRTPITRSLSPWCASRSASGRAIPRRCDSSRSRFTATARC